MSKSSIVKMLVQQRTQGECDAAIGRGLVAHNEFGDHFLEVEPIFEQAEGMPDWIMGLANEADKEGAEYILIHP